MSLHEGGEGEGPPPLGRKGQLGVISPDREGEMRGGGILSFLRGLDIMSVV